MNRNSLKILIVDDDASVRRNLEKVLEREGYIVETVSGSQDAQDKLQAQAVHLAILDLWMPNLKGEVSDRAGIELLEWIRRHHPETFVVMLTGAGTIKNAMEAINLGASDYIEKDQLRPTELGVKIRDVVKINFDLKIDLNSGVQLSKEEDEEVLRRLFLESSEIKVSCIAQGSRGSVIYRVTSRSLNGEWRIPFATKITWKDQILKEEENYHKWVEHRLGGARYANMLGKAVYTFNRGGINMSFLNAELDGLREFRLFFRNSPTPAILEAISSLFENTLSYWYESKEFTPLFLIQEYANYLDAEKWDLNRYMSRYLKEFAGVSQVNLEQIGLNFLNPIGTFEKLLKLSNDYEKRTYISTTHGDLHASNILVDNRNNCWLIDFSSTGRSHILRDFIELEVAIKFNVVKTENLQHLFDLESVLLSQKGFRDTLNFSHPNEEVQKAFEVIKKIRECASLTIAPNNDMQEYYIGLLFHSLNMLRFPPSAVSQTKKMCILYSASLILKYLEQDN